MTIPGLSVVKVALIGLALTAIVGVYQELRVRHWSSAARIAETALTGERQRSATLARQVRAANDGIALCEQANASNVTTLRQCHAATGDLARETRRLDELLAATRREARAVRAARDREDAELSVRTEVPLPEILQIERARGQGWLWR